MKIISGIKLNGSHKNSDVNDERRNLKKFKSCKCH